MTGYLWGAVAGAVLMFAASISGQRVGRARVIRSRALVPIPVIPDRAVPASVDGERRASFVEELLGGYEIVVAQRWVLGRAVQAEASAERRSRLEALQPAARRRVDWFRSAVLEEMRKVPPQPTQTDFSDGLVERAVAMLNAGEHAAAMEIIAAQKDQLANPWVALTYGAALRDGGEHAQAVAFLAEQIESGRFTGADLLMLAKARTNCICNDRVGDHAGAIAAAEFSLLLAPDDAKALYMRANADLKFGTYTTEGLEAARRALALEPANANYRYVAMCIAGRTGDMSAAVEYAKQLLAVGTPKPTRGSLLVPHLLLSQSLISRGRMLTAGNHLRQAVALSDGSATKACLVAYLTRWVGVVNSACFGSALWVSFLAVALPAPALVIAISLVPALFALVGGIAVLHAAGQLPRSSVWAAVRQAGSVRARVSGGIAIASLVALPLSAVTNGASAAGVAVVWLELLWTVYVRSRTPRGKSVKGKRKAA